MSRAVYSRGKEDVHQRKPVCAPAPSLEQVFPSSPHHIFHVTPQVALLGTAAVPRRCKAFKAGACSRQDGLPAPGFSAAEVVAGVVASGAVGLLAPVHARHQRDLQQGSQHGAHNLHAGPKPSALLPVSLTLHDGFGGCMEAGRGVSAHADTTSDTIFEVCSLPD